MNPRNFACGRKRWNPGSTKQLEDTCQFTLSSSLPEELEEGGKVKQDVKPKERTLRNWAHQITFKALTLFPCLSSCLWAELRMNIPFVFFEDCIWWEIWGPHWGWPSAHPSTLRCCQWNRPGKGHEVVSPHHCSLWKGRENNHVFILPADSVQMCFLNGTCDTFIFFLWCLEPELFPSFPAAQGNTVGNLLSFQTNSITLTVCFVF